MVNFESLSTSLKFLTVGFFGAIIIHIINVLIGSFLVLPLLIKEASVKNGLAVLRRQMLAEVILYIAMSIISVFALTGRFIFGSSETSRYLIVIMVFLHSIFSLAKIVIYRKIYHQSFSDEQKRLHAIIAELESKLKEKE